MVPLWQKKSVWQVTTIIQPALCHLVTSHFQEIACNWTPKDQIRWPIFLMLLCMIVLTEKTSKFPQPIIFWILVFSCHKMTLITKITWMPRVHWRCFHFLCNMIRIAVSNLPLVAIVTATAPTRPPTRPPTTPAIAILLSIVNLKCLSKSINALWCRLKISGSQVCCGCWWRVHQQNWFSYTGFFWPQG